MTSVLIHYKSPFAAVTLPRLLNQSPRMQAASPALETARLFSLLGTGSALVTAFGGLLLIIAGLGFFVTLYAAVEERRYDIALLRALGATRGHVLRLVLFEGLLLGSGGVALGLALGHAGIWVLDRYAEGTRHLHLSDSGLTPEEGVLALIALGIGLIASILPAMMATRVDIAKILARGS